MLKKLLKYDLKWTLKNLIIFMGLGTFFAIIGRILDLTTDSLFFDIISGICKGAALSLTISALVNAIIRSWVRMGSNMYKDESYLTHTLPVTRSTHYYSKCIHSVICVVLTVMVILLNVFILYYSKENMEILKSSLNMLASALDISAFGFIILVFFIVIAEALFIIQCGYFGIIMGNRHNTKKGLFVFVYSFVIYMISNTVTIIGLVIVSQFHSGLNAIIMGGSTTIEFGLLVGICFASLIIYVSYTIVLFVISNLFLNKGINVD